MEYITLLQAKRKVIPSMVLMKEVSFIFDRHLPNPEVFCKVFEDNKSCIAVAESKNSHQEQNISLLSITIYKDYYKRILFGYDILIHRNKQKKFSLSHLKKHY